MEIQEAITELERVLTCLNDVGILIGDMEEQENPNMTTDTAYTRLSDGEENLKEVLEYLKGRV